MDRAIRFSRCERLTVNTMRRKLPQSSNYFPGYSLDFETDVFVQDRTGNRRQPAHRLLISVFFFRLATQVQPNGDFLEGELLAKSTEEVAFPTRAE